MKALFFFRIHCNCKAKEIKTTSAVVFLCVLLKGGKTGLAAKKKNICITPIMWSILVVYIFPDLPKEFNDF